MGVGVAELPSGTVTFLFTDLEGSTRLWEEHPEAMRTALARHDEILRGAIEAHGGHVVKTTGDGLHAVFATAHDAVAPRSTRSARSARSRGMRRARCGCGWGCTPARREHRDGDYYGTALNRAARLMAVAHGGQIVVSRRDGGARRATRCPPRSSSSIWVSTGCAILARPERVFQVVAPGAHGEFPPLRSLDAFSGEPAGAADVVRRPRGDSPRSREALSETRLVTLTGVGGVGKTRLALQVAAEVLPRFRRRRRGCASSPRRAIRRVWCTWSRALRSQPAPGDALDEEHGRRILA